MKKIFLFFMVLLTGCTITQSHDLTNDLNFIYHQILENHPGIHNDRDPSFKQHMDAQYSIAHEQLSKNYYLDLHQEIIKDFCKSFNDSHLWVNYPEKTPVSKIPKTHRCFSIENIEPKIAWITLPTFDFDTTHEKEFASVLSNMAPLRTNHTIVFDIRGNQGGNSHFATQIIESLFGEDYTQQQQTLATKDQSVDWAISPDNVSHVKSLSQRLKLKWIEQVSKCMEECLTSHQKYYHKTNSPIEPSSTFTHNVSSKIIVIIDGCNVSAALDFIDTLKMMNYPITLIGQTTKADRLYMEVRTINLPSKLGTFSFPIKVYRNRPRKDNEPHKPDIECDTTNTDSLKALILSIKN